MIKNKSEKKSGKINMVYILPLLFLAACSPQGSKNTETGTNDKATDLQSNEINTSDTEIIKVINPRVRSPLGGKEVTAAYLTIENPSDREIIINGGETNIGKRLELHTHEKSNDGMMQMRQVDELSIPARGTLKLEPMDAHLMIFELNDGLKEGDIAKITLNRKDGQKIFIEAPLVNNPILPSEKTSEHKH